MKNIIDNIVNEFTANPAASIVDVILVAAILYVIFSFMKKNNGGRMIKYIVIFILISAVLASELIGLKIFGSLVKYFVPLAAIAVILLFPQEIRKVLWKLSSPKELRQAYTTQYDASDDDLKKAIADIVKAVQNMAKKDVGALIVVTPNTVPSHIVESGTYLDAKLSCPLIESVFNTKAPLHDGAVFIRGNRIVAAGCFLPLTESLGIDKELGTRHRAAIGVTEAYDVVTIIVSEETGIISVAIKGRLMRYYDSAMLTDVLEKVYGLKASDEVVEKKRKRKRA